MEGEPWVITDNLIWMTMLVGINEITEKTAPEFFKRLYAYQLVRGPMVMYTDKTQNRFISLADITRRIGLKTNASPRTQAQFNKDVLIAELYLLAMQAWQEQQAVADLVATNTQRAK